MHAILFENYFCLVNVDDFKFGHSALSSEFYKRTYHKKKKKRSVQYSDFNLTGKIKLLIGCQNTRAHYNPISCTTHILQYTNCVLRITYISAILSSFICLFIFNLACLRIESISLLLYFSLV